jgi:hypothetical protein
MRIVLNLYLFYYSIIPYFNGIRYYKSNIMWTFSILYRGDILFPLRKLFDSINRTIDAGKYLTMSNHKNRYINNCIQILSILMKQNI